MNILSLVSQILLYVALLGLTLWGIKYATLLYFFSRKQEDINKLTARISILKLHLKGKIKRKCNKIGEFFNKELDPAALRALQPKLNAINSLEFVAATDYQSLINSLSSISEDITNSIKFKHKFYNAPSSDPIQTPEKQNSVNENCKNLVRYDKANMMIIVEIIQCTERLVEKISEYNLLIRYKKSQKKITQIPERIVIENYIVIAELIEQVKKSKFKMPNFNNLEADVFKESA